MRIIGTIIQILLGIIIGLLFVYYSEHPFYHLTLFLAFAFFINNFIHEIGHMVFGKLARTNTIKIVIGKGQKVIFKFRFWGTIIEVTNGIGGAFSFPDDFENKNTRMKLCIYTLGGIFFNGAAALASYFISVNIETKILSTILILFCYSNILTAVISLIPFTINAYGTSIPNDGLKLIQIPFYNEKQLKHFLASGKIVQAAELIKRKKYNEAKEIYVKTAEKFPENVALKTIIASMYISELKIEKAQKKFRELINNLEPFEKNYKYIIMYSLAYLSLFTNNENYKLADDYSKQIYNSFGKYVPYKIIRGCVLVNSEKTKEGINILKKCVNLKKGINKINNNTLAFLYLAYGFYKEEKIEEAIEYIDVIESQINTLNKEQKYLYDKIISKTNNFERKIADC